MTQETITYALLAGLAITLLFSVYTDMRYRLIYNKVTLSIAIAAPLFWYASNLSWGAIALQLGIALGAFFFFALFAYFKLMGGGDVKLFTVLALWFPWDEFLRLALYASIAGGFITLFYAIGFKMRRRKGTLKVPYGVAIAIGGLLIAGQRLFNHFP